MARVHVTWIRLSIRCKFSIKVNSLTSNFHAITLPVSPCLLYKWKPVRESLANPLSFISYLLSIGLFGLARYIGSTLLSSVEFEKIVSNWIHKLLPRTKQCDKQKKRQKIKQDRDWFIIACSGGNCNCQVMVTWNIAATLYKFYCLATAQHTTHDGCCGYSMKQIHTILHIYSGLAINPTFHGQLYWHKVTKHFLCLSYTSCDIETLQRLG